MSEPTPPPPDREPTQEEISAALAARLARTPVRDVLLQCMATFIDMAGIRLGMGPNGDEARDLPQARQAIEALRALLGVAERELGSAQVNPFKEPLAVLQMAYARAIEEPTPGEGPDGEAAEGPGEPPPPLAPAGRPGRPPVGAPGEPPLTR